MRASQQPLSYQQQLASCWITSTLNGLTLMLGSANRIPNILARMLYSGTSNDGTENRQAKCLVALINEYYGGKLRCSIKTGEEVTPGSVASYLRRGAKIVADTGSGTHAVLLTGIEDGRLLLFDPDWDTIWTCRHGQEGRYSLELDQRTYNVRVTVEEFFKDYGSRNRPFSMGAVSRRFILIMQKLRARNGA